MESPSHSLASSVYSGGTFYFTLPVELAANAASLRIRCPRSTPGSQYTPCDPMLLVAAEGLRPTLPLQTPNSVCDDSDGNGIRDGADEVIKAMNIPLAPICDPH